MDNDIFELKRQFVTPETSIRAVIEQGIDLMQKNQLDDLKDLQNDFAKVFVPLCPRISKVVSEVEIPRDLGASRLQDIAPVLTQEQGQKLSRELFELSIPSLFNSAGMIIAIKNGAKPDQDVKIGFLSRIVLKLLYRSIETDNLVKHISETTNLTWMDDEKGEVKRTLRATP